MRRSQSFIKTQHNAPADEESKNAQLLIRAGYIHKQMAGAYAYLPLGLRVLENIKQIVREEMNALGGQELIMTNLQPKELWEKTDRWDEQKVDAWFKTNLQNGTQIGLAWSHEEPVTDMMRNFIASYRDLPAGVYQFQTKLRNELRAKSGIMRGREFVMKDLYSFAASREEHDKYYQTVTEAYKKIFERVGLGDITYVTFASGGAFTQFSHEFQTITEVGEDTIYLDRDKKLAVNQEVYTDEVLAQLDLDKTKLEKVKAAEVGNIFSFGTTKAEELGLYFTDEVSHAQPVYLGSYGVGVTRLMGLLAELFADGQGLKWPAVVAPYKVYLIDIGQDEAVNGAAEELYANLAEAGIDVIYDDRDERPGGKFADADLMGIPYRLVVSSKTLEAGGYELKKRGEEETKIVPADSVIEILAN